LQLVKSLLASGADINAKDNNGWTPLIEAAQEDHLEIVTLLLEKGADINSKTTKGATALIIAAQQSHF